MLDARCKDGNRESNNINGRYHGHLWLDQKRRDPFVSSEGRNRISRTDNRLEPLLQDLVNKGIDDNLRSAEYENRFLQIIEDVKSPSRHLMMMTEAMLDDQDLTALAATNVKKKTEKAVHLKTKRAE